MEATDDLDELGLPAMSAPIPTGQEDCWPLAIRDSVPNLTPAGAPGDVGSALLFALLSSDGTEWIPPYEQIREALKVRKKPVLPELEEQKDQRIRTWMVLFRALGLVYEEGGELHVTPLGQQLRDIMASTYEATDSYAREMARATRWQLARVVGPSLARYQLRNPATSSAYPPDTDVHPLWAIWRAMRSLDSRLHWDEFDRTITRCLTMASLDQAIERIREARQTDGYDPDDPALLEQLLGSRCPQVGGQPDRLERNQHDRVILWFQQAGYRDIFLERTERSDGYRHLNEEFLPLLDDLLASPPPHNNTTDAEEYFRWLGDTQLAAYEFQRSPFTGSELLHQVVERCRKHGRSRIVALVGPAGTGKTQLARETALVLADSDLTRVEFVQFHAAFTYEEFIGGLAPLKGGGFAPTPGLLIDFNDRASRARNLTHVLVIDELSRADIANVLGELLTYVEYRDREFLIPAIDETIQLQPNLIVIATLNPADRSVINMDDALVRRLRQIPIDPNTQALSIILDANGMASSLRDQVCAWFDSLPADVPFGHGLFVDVAHEGDLYDLWHEQLRYFLRRGGVNVYRDPQAIEQGYLWRRRAWRADSGESEANREPSQAQGETGVAAEPPVEGSDSAASQEPGP